ncbi:hypothetical protein P6O80_15555, partial [Clostridium perfringens]|nr:hypothetical protein [Clostridium perfringens]
TVAPGPPVPDPETAAGELRKAVVALRPDRLFDQMESGLSRYRGGDLPLPERELWSRRLGAEIRRAALAQTLAGLAPVAERFFRSPAGDPARKKRS